MRALTIVAALFARSAVAAAAPAPPLGRVVLVGQLDQAAARRAAKTAGGARWEVRTLAARAREKRAPPAAALARLERLYLEADFVGCLSHMQREALGVDQLLAQGRADEAARAAILGAACAHDAGDRELARRLLARVVAAELPTAALARTKPAVQRLMETLQARRASKTRQRVELFTQPAGARVSIDANRTRCASAPCSVRLRPGRHVVVAKLLGHLPRQVILAVRAQARQRRVIKLDPAPADLARKQLAALVAGGGALDSRAAAATAAEAFSAQVVVLVRSSASRCGGARGRCAARAQLRASLYDRKLKRIVARATRAEKPGALAKCVRAVIEEWRGKVEPTPLWKRPLFWGITAGALAAGALTVFFLTRPTQKDYVLEIPADSR